MSLRLNGTVCIVASDLLVDRRCRFFDCDSMAPCGCVRKCVLASRCSLTSLGCSSGNVDNGDLRLRMINWLFASSSDWSGALGLLKFQMNTEEAAYDESVVTEKLFWMAYCYMHLGTAQ